MTQAKRKAGRPKAEPTTPVMIRLTEGDRLAFLEMGGARFFKLQIKAYRDSKKPAPVVVIPAK